MNLLLALLPAIFWGINPLIIKKINGQTANEMFGTGLGALIMSIVAFLVVGSFNGMSTVTFLLSFISGAAWAIGQLGQFMSFRTIGISKTMPISTGIQLTGTSIIGVIAFGEWQGVINKVIGFLAIAVLILGVFIISKTGQQNDKQNIQDYLPLFITSIGYWVYSCIPKAIDANGLQLFSAQMLGTFVVATIYAFYKSHRVLQEKQSWLNTIPGLLYGLASLSYIFAARKVGVSTAFVIGQINVVISTLGSIFILKESKQGKDLVKTTVGLGLILLASCVTAFL
ncbi:GRP family sugar transporter [Xylocopilactobacillus apicola]|uniref:Sugar uptake protein n=1 Tax=Xylocopilactobacillus apicola TaxID=2932184 RepID=A0AAU9DE03_9LACO|nr:GRP family sugar transporter [Xylocopilactobacillus apicola]BDR58065.1 putative sugar uptake protein [Xylocopilactobacillus apicola]